MCIAVGGRVPCVTRIHDVDRFRVDDVNAARARLRRVLKMKENGRKAFRLANVMRRVVLSGPTAKDQDGREHEFESLRGVFATDPQRKEEFRRILGTVRPLTCYYKVDAENGVDIRRSTIRRSPGLVFDLRRSVL